MDLHIFAKLKFKLKFLFATHTLSCSHLIVVGRGSQGFSKQLWEVGTRSRSDKGGYSKDLTMAPRTQPHASETKEQILRRKLVNTEMNPIVDVVLSLVILVLTPFIYLFSLIHDKLMFKFLNKTYIYNVSWEVQYCFLCFVDVLPCIN